MADYLRFGLALWLGLSGLAGAAHAGQGESLPPVISEEEAALIAGNTAFDASDYEGALAAYHRISPLELPAYARNRLALSYHLLNRLREAQALYRLGISRGEDLAPLHNNLGALRYAAQDFGDAEDEFKDALRYDPENRLVQGNLRAAKYARENGRAVRAFIEGSDANPLLGVREGDLFSVTLLMPPDRLEEAAQLERRGDAFLVRKLFEDAVIEYERALEIDPYNALLFNKIGLAHHQNQDVDRAQDAYRDALDLNPYYVPSLNNLGSIEQAKRNYERALRYYEEALKIKPDSATVLQNVGSCLFAMERWDAGLAYYIEALRLDPNLFDQAGAGLGALVQTAQRNESMVNLYMAKLFAETGDPNRTMSYLYRAVEEGLADPALLDDPVFALLSDDERFVQLRASLAGSPG